MLNSSRIQSALSEKGLPFAVTCLDTTTSTNNEIKLLIEQEASEGSVVTALRQESGYGRQGRLWSSPEGGLYFSVLLRPQCFGVAPVDLPTLSLVVALAVYDLIQFFSDDTTLAIKWPNDVVCSRGKLCGISLEAVSDAVCVGIGANVFALVEPEKTQGIFSAACLEDIAALSGSARLTHPQGAKQAAVGQESDRLADRQKIASPPTLNADQCQTLEDIMVSLLGFVEVYYRRWLEEGFVSLRKIYNERAFLNGRFVQIALTSGDIVDQGTVVGIDERGNLVLRDARGNERAVASGEAHILLGK